jgi:hypothetical protein
MGTISYNSKNYPDASYNDLYADLSINTFIEFIKTNDISITDDENNATKGKMSSDTEETINEFNRKLQLSNVGKMKDMIDIFKNHEKTSFSEIKKNHDFSNSQNETTKTTFIERYLFLIVKIIFFLVFIGVFLFKVREHFSEENISNVQSSFINSVKETIPNNNNL